MSYIEHKGSVYFLRHIVKISPIYDEVKFPARIVGRFFWITFPDGQSVQITTQDQPQIEEYRNNLINSIDHEYKNN